MRRSSAIFLLISILLMLALAVTTVGCGATASSLKASPAGQSPEEILSAALTASSGMTSGTGTFDMSLSFDIDTSELSEEEAAFIDQPMSVSGTFALMAEPQGGEASVAISLAGESTDIGVKFIEDRFWLNLLDQWYEAPPEMVGFTGDFGDTEAQMAEMEELLSDLGIDPLTWINDLRLVGEETVDGAAVYHLTGSPDMAKLMGDLIGLLESEEIWNLIDPSGSMEEMMGSEMGTMPSADELQEMQTQVAAMFEDFTVDVWIEKDTSLLRKMTASVYMTPPPGEDFGGFYGMDLRLDMLLDNVNQPVNVEAPASALPFSELERAMEEDPEMFMELFGGMSLFGPGGASYSY